MLEIDQSLKMEVANLKEVANWSSGFGAALAESRGRIFGVINDSAQSDALQLFEGGDPISITELSERTEDLIAIIKSNNYSGLLPDWDEDLRSDFLTAVMDAHQNKHGKLNGEDKNGDYWKVRDKYQVYLNW